MAQDPKPFLRRWSQRKIEAGKAAPAVAPPVPTAPQADAPALPSIDSLTFESDFVAFMQAKVDEGVKRAALKKLFTDPRFNLMDGLDVYIDDYSVDDPIPQAMLAQLEHARTTLFGRAEETPVAAEQSGAPEPPAAVAGAQDEAPSPDDPGSKDGAAG